MIRLRKVVTPSCRPHGRLPSAILAFALAGAAGLAAAADVTWGTDVPGGVDHPLVRRFAGSWLVAHQKQPWDQTLWPTSLAVAASDRLKDTVTVEGEITRLVYLAPAGKSPLEVFRNHEQAFAAAGFKREFSCEQACDAFYWAWSRQTKPTDGLRWQTQGSIPAGEGGGRYSMSSALQSSHGRFWVGTSPRGAKVLLYTGDAANEKTGLATALLQIVEPKSMTTGQVEVADAAALQLGLSEQGKATLGGLLFDTGKAQLKPDSKPQLEAMATVLKAQSTWKVFIVGHTDNVGEFDANLALSQQRAQAVVTALAAAPFNIDARRMSAKGAANIAPAAPNSDEAGRARNRRVEMVLQ